MALGAEERAVVVRSLTSAQAREFSERWWLWALKAQREPAGDWLVWVICAGRGFGKTRAGAEWVSQFARDNPDARIALVGATADDARRVMVDGESGLLAVARTGEREAMRWTKMEGVLHFASGAVAQVYSAGAAEALRGPQHHAAWCDELGKWQRGLGDKAWDNLRLGLRLGDRPRIIVTTTPRQTRLMRAVLAMEGVHQTRGRTTDNAWLPKSFIEAMTAEYGGTRMGRQELDGELVAEAEGALWSRALVERQRTRAAPALVRVVVGVDPPASADGDACGIVAVGRDAAGHAHVLEDATVAGASPERWASAVAGCAARWQAERVIAEKNQGGDMVRSVLLAADAALPVTLVSASRGKAARAEPVSMLYERGAAWHAGTFPALEDELCGLMAAGGYAGPGRSPDRADALVWAMSELMLGRRARAAVRTLAPPGG
ncbi:terminase family protein [Sphingomonas canadensis]|nr:terminase family protein [Sphingomonas canadensis]MCW3834510.1 terminase family protein [Sphingomonas canadensis]